jgi:hypothetical protein
MCQICDLDFLYTGVHWSTHMSDMFTRRYYRDTLGV